MIVLSAVFTVATSGVRENAVKANVASKVKIFIRIRCLVDKVIW